MRRTIQRSVGLAALFFWSGVSEAQGPPTPPVATPPPPIAFDPAAGPATPRPGSGLEAESLPAEIAEDFEIEPPVYRLGPTPASDVGILMENLGAWRLFGNTGIRAFGWVEGGYTGASTGPGLLNVQTRQNRFGDEFLLNQIGFTIQKPLRRDAFDLGFNVRYFAGADAALGTANRGASEVPPKIRGSARTSATSTYRPTCRSSPRGGSA